MMSDIRSRQASNRPLSDEEKEIIERNSHLQPSHIVKMLSGSGFSRSTNSVKGYLARSTLRAEAPSPGETPDYAGLDAAFCAALRAAHPERETGPCGAEPRGGIATHYSAPFRHLGSGWQIEDQL